MPALSILLPIYNGETFLEEQVRSIQEQSFADWHLLIGDDGSSDGSVQVIHRLAAADPRIRIVAGAGNMGQKRRLRELARAAESELIAVSDQDDVWQPDKLTLLLDALGGADLCFGSSWLIDEHGRELGRELLDNLPPRYRSGDRLSLLFRPAVSAHAMIARRRLFEGMSFERFTAFDWLLSLEAAFGHGIVYVPAARTMHRMHANNQMNGQHIAMRPAAKLFSRYETRNVTRSVGLSRVTFLGLIEHLIHAETVAEPVRKRMRETHRLCVDSWWQPVEPRLPAKALATRVSDLLRPLAGSEQDWRYAAEQIELMCRGAFSLHRFVACAQRLRATP